MERCGRNHEVLVWHFGAEWETVQVKVHSLKPRYHNHLDDKISKAEWTPKEDETLLMLHNRLGNRWALIAREIKGRYVTFKI